MAAAVYIESSVISYPTARPTRDVVTSARQAITIEWWENRRDEFDVYISALVEQEISAGDPQAARLRLDAIADIPTVAITSIAEELAKLLVDSGAIPASNVEDALHIGIAAAQGAEYLLTWTFKNINNAQTRAVIERVIESQGYACPVLCSPEEPGGLL